MFPKFHVEPVVPLSTLNELARTLADLYYHVACFVSTQAARAAIAGLRRLPAGFAGDCCRAGIDAGSLQYNDGLVVHTVGPTIPRQARSTTARYRSQKRSF